MSTGNEQVPEAIPRGVAGTWFTWLLRSASFV